MKNIIKEQIMKLINSREWTIVELSEKSNVPLNTLKNILYGRTINTKIETLMAIAEAFDVSVDFLIGRKKYAEEEMTLLRNYRKMSSHGQKFVLAMSEFEKNYTLFEEEQLAEYEINCYIPEVATEDSKIKYIVPCLEPTGSFKDGILYDTSVKTRIKTHLKNAFMAVKIPNDALANTYFTNDIVFLERRIPEIGEIAIYHKDNYIYIRKYGKDKNTNKHILHSLNINNEDIFLTNSEMSQYSVVGTCFYIYRKKDKNKEESK